MNKELNNAYCLSPIALFVYNRPLHTRKTVAALAKNKLADQSDLIIFSDAPKSERDMQKVQDVREYLKTIAGFKSIKIIERHVNWGLAKSIIAGVTDVINKFGKVIVLEDDLVTSRHFLYFMNEALKKYENEKVVWQIGGYHSPIHPPIGMEKECFFTSYTTSWGWATWEDRWASFEREPGKLLKTFDVEAIRKFNIDNTDNIWDQVLDNAKGNLYTWAVFWYANVFQNNGLVFYPPCSIVENIGHDGSGQNCGISSDFKTKILDYDDWTYPKEMLCNEIVMQFTKLYNLNRRSFIHRIKNKIGRIWL